MTQELDLNTELLKSLHILTRDGKLNADSNRKLKQIGHLYHFIEPIIQSIADKEDSSSTPVVMDMGAGKSYLGFILYDLWFRKHNRGHMINVESREELIQKSQTTARQCGFERMQFLQKNIADTSTKEAVHLITALHACDTATDDTISFALEHDIPHIVIVPCCQAELAQQLDGIKHPTLGQLWRHPLHRREFASHLTNVMRALVLESHGYKVRITELVGWEHSLKNELIIGERHQRGNADARNKLKALTDSLQAFPTKLKKFI